MRRLTQIGPSIVVLTTALLVLFAGPTAVKRLAFAQTEAQVRQASDRLSGSNILEEFNRASRDIAAAMEPSVVHISVEQLVFSSRRRPPNAQVSSGSGWIFDADGHIVTNYHVVKGARKIEVQLASGERRPAEMVGYDEFTDIAVIKVSGGGLHPARLGDVAEPVQQGDLVFAFGSPFDFRFSMSQGIVSGKGRAVGVIRPSAGRPFENFIQVDAAINPGNSGGPLTNFRGEVIGMNTAIATGGRRSVRPEDGAFSGIGLAIPLDMIVPTVTQLIETGVVRKGFLGINIAELDDVPLTLRDAVQRFRGRGVVVTMTDAGGPANLSGLRPGDVITDVNGKTVGSVSQLQSIISSMIPGDTADISIWRNDQPGGGVTEQTVLVTLDRLSTLRVAGKVPDDQPLDRIPEIGIEQMTTLDRQIARQYGIEAERGVVIESLVDGMYLERRLEPGSVIIQVGDARVSNTSEFVEALRQYNLLMNGARVVAILPSGEVRREQLFVPAS